MTFHQHDMLSRNILCENLERFSVYFRDFRILTVLLGREIFILPIAKIFEVVRLTVVLPLGQLNSVVSNSCLHGVEVNIWQRWTKSYWFFLSFFQNGIFTMSTKTVLTVICIFLMIDLYPLYISATAPLRRMPLNGSIYGKRTAGGLVMSSCLCSRFTW